MKKFITEFKKFNIVSILLIVILIGSSCSTEPEKSSEISSEITQSESQPSATKEPVDRNKNKNNLPEGFDMDSFIESEEADSGVNGDLYYVNLNTILNELGTDTVIKYDFLRFASVLQGLSNREESKVFMELNPDSDIFWYNYLRQDDSLLFGMKKIEINTLDRYFEVFEDQIKDFGLILWDEKVNASANAATTVSGIEGYLPIRNTKGDGSLYKLIADKIGEVKVNMDLTDMFTGSGTIPGTNRQSSGSAKNDAYIWIIENYFDRTHETIMGQVPDAMFWNESGVKYPDLPNTGMINIDYFIANKAIMFDLSIWGDETPNDDKNQPLGTDLNTLKELLQKMYDRTEGKEIISVSGFVPWHIKYTRYKNMGKHGEVETEWMTAKVYSAYNALKDADAIGYLSIANASLYRHYEIKEKLENNRPDETIEYESKKKYIMFYMGDYDSASWTARFIPKFWKDNKRGTNPLAWAVNANLSERIPMVYEYMYKYKTGNDYFVTGNSGAGYINPTFLIEPRQYSENPSGLETWVEHNNKYLSKMDLDITGFLLNGAMAINEEIMDAYAKMTPEGVMTHNYLFEGKMHNGTPFISISNIDGGALSPNPLLVAEKILETTNTRNSNPKLYAVRSVLCSPTYIDQVISILKSKDPNIEVVDPYTFFDIVRQIKE